MTSWLSYENGEVESFHTEFKLCADNVINELGLNEKYEWCHHLRTIGVSTVPDFVLRDKKTGKWLLAYEIKRTPDAVLSTRFQLQAKGYAEANQDLFVARKPKYFVLSNLELSLLFALNGENDPKGCQVKGGVFDSGTFANTTKEEHKRIFTENLKTILEKILSDEAIVFEYVWEKSINLFSELLENIHTSTFPDTAPLENSIEAVKSFFGASSIVDQKRSFSLACLLTEFLKGILLRFNHPKARTIPPLRANLNSFKNIIAFISKIDFAYLYSDIIPTIELLKDSEVKSVLDDFFKDITIGRGQLLRFTTERSDYLQLLDNVMLALYPIDQQHLYGKIQTDHELSAVLATLLISKSSQVVIDPCCGDGSLLLAAYDRLTDLGVTPLDISKNLHGVEIDTFASKVCITRLLMKSPKQIRPNQFNNIISGDLFQNSHMISNSNVILMNPPFIRYENQGERPIPASIKEYYQSRINFDYGETATLSGQPNLYNYYIEYVGRAMSENAKMGIVLDNKWYHSKLGSSLRKYFLDHFKVLGIVEYPHTSFFSSWSIATSLVLVEKCNSNDRKQNNVKFIRCNSDPREADLRAISNAFLNGEWPYDWSCNTVKQKDLGHSRGWKTCFSTSSADEFLQLDLPTLSDLFKSKRRGSLEKEGGGVQNFEFPFNRSNYGPVRMPKKGGSGFATSRGRKLTNEENESLRSLANQIPTDFRGFAIKNADSLTSYNLIESDVTKDETIESPLMRSNYAKYCGGRIRWGDFLKGIVSSLLSNDEIRAYASSLKEQVNLGPNLHTPDKLWNVIREPIAGSLILPRKMRNGHKVHINSWATDLTSRQVRLSSNFVTFSQINLKHDEFSENDLVVVIAAFLLSSFGQLQFEMLGYNREGCLSLELHQFEKIKIINPLEMTNKSIRKVIDIFPALPYPIDSRKLSVLQVERNLLDNVFAEEFSRLNENIEKNELLNNVHSSLDEWLIARNL